MLTYRIDWAYHRGGRHPCANSQACPTDTNCTPSSYPSSAVCRSDAAGAAEAVAEVAAEAEAVDVVAAAAVVVAAAAVVVVVAAAAAAAAAE